MSDDFTGKCGDSVRFGEGSVVTSEQPQWEQQMAKAFVVAGVEAVAWVPDKRIAPVADILAQEGLCVRSLTREEECIGYAAGYRAAGGMPLVMMQSSGLGNSINAIGSLVVPFGLGFPMVVSMRGSLGELNPSQINLGRAATGMLNLLGIESFDLRAPGQIPALIKAACSLSESGRQIAPIILRPELGYS